MAKDSRIEWTHHTFNPWWGCVKVSPGCKHCYAEAWAKRTGQEVWGPTATRRELSDSYWRQPIAWNAEAVRIGKRRRVFCASMADVFEDRRDLDARRERLWGLIEQTPNLDWLLLTKRPQNVGRLSPYGEHWPGNVWLGATAENQRWLDKRMEYLTALKARILFLSCEPLLGPLDFSQWIARASHGLCRAIDWVIAGGESGHYARPMHPEWVRGVRDQCVANGVPFHFKQWGNWSPACRGGDGREVRRISASDGASIVMVKLNKKLSGRVLDGDRWDGVPAAV